MNQEDKLKGQYSTFESYIVAGVASLTRAFDEISQIINAVTWSRQEERISTMRQEDITQERIEKIIFICPLTSESVIVLMSQLEIRTQITDGKFQWAQLGIQCQACGRFHLSDLTETGFLSIRGTTLERWIPPNKATPNGFTWEYHGGKRIALSNGPTDALVATGDSESSWLDISDENAQVVQDAFNKQNRIQELERHEIMYSKRLLELKTAIQKHRSQKADDRCVEDDDELYAALSDGIKCDRKVGDKVAMLENCARFIERRCEGGGWPTYQELESQITNALGIPIGINDCNGYPIHTGDTLRFAKHIWYRDTVTEDKPLSSFPEMEFQVKLEKGSITHPGVSSDLTAFCAIIRKWDELSRPPWLLVRKPYCACGTFGDHPRTQRCNQ